MRASADISRLDLRLAAAPESLAMVRKRIAAFTARHGIADPGDVALAVTEAATNAVLHAYRDGAAGTMRVVACAEPTGLVVVVRDYGVGMQPNPLSPGAGLGLSVIGAVAEEMNVERPADGGTRIRIRFALSPAVAA
jgi:serine/threonine-protein kinase RsbW/stage II sporulation protein AB (anti-sigma F factor)